MVATATASSSEMLTDRSPVEASELGCCVRAAWEALPEAPLLTAALVPLATFPLETLFFMPALLPFPFGAKVLPLVPSPPHESLPSAGC